jgi:hypothetical protein
MTDSAVNTSDGPMRKSLPQRAPAAASNLRRFTVWTMVGIAIGIVIVLLVARQANLDPTPTLTPELFEAAHERWKTKPLADYDIEIRVTGPQAAVYRAQVRGGEAQVAWRNGKPLTTRRTFGTWSIPGMFSTISRDVAAVERAAAKGAANPLILRASFNSQHGYPEHYRRIDNGSRKGGDAIAVTWDVTEFRVVGMESSSGREAENGS